MADLPSDIPRPSHAYVPGKNARHPEGWFDGLKHDVAAVLDPAQLHQSRAWQAGRAYLDAGYFWECHEMLEAVWLLAPDGSPERDMVQALIQLANARLKLLMERPQAARRLCDMVDAHLARCPVDRPILGLDRADVTSWVNVTRRDAEA